MLISRYTVAFWLSANDNAAEFDRLGIEFDVDSPSMPLPVADTWIRFSDKLTFDVGMVEHRYHNTDVPRYQVVVTPLRFNEVQIARDALSGTLETELRQYPEVKDVRITIVKDDPE